MKTQSNADINMVEIKEWLEMQIEFLKSLQSYKTIEPIMSEHNVMIRCYQGTLDKIKEIEDTK